VLPLLAGVYYWYPKMTGRMLDDRLGTVSFILIFLGINVTFFPMHLAGLDGMPRRVYTYPSGLGWDRYQALATVGSAFLALGMLAYLANLLVSVRRGAVAGPNPWSAGTLEWLTESPPEDEAFPYTPVVQSAYPLWNVHTEPAMVEVIEPVRNDRRESLGTSIIEGQPEQRTVEPGPSLVPLVTAACVALALVGAAVDPLVSLAGMALTAVAALRWAWPTPEQQHEAAHPSEQDRLPTSWTASERGLTTPPQHAILGAMAAIGAFDLSVIAVYWYLAQANPRWPVAGVDVPDWWPIVLSCVLLGMAAAGAWAGRPGGRIAPVAGLAICIAATLAACLATALELASEDWNWATNSSGSAEWAVLVTAGMVAASSAVIAAAAAGYARAGLFTAGALDALVVSRWYATFAFAVSLVAAVTVEIGPRVL